MEQERLLYPEAIEWLANKAGIKVPDDFESPDYKEMKAQIEKIHNINKEAAQFYHNSLYSSAGQASLTYLKNRQLTDNTIKAFGIGYSPDSSSLAEYLTKKGYDLSTMQKAGLIRIDKNGKPYDIFFERIMFPIIDAQDKVIGFGGRIFNKSEDFAKYVNTSANPAFNKSKSLYSINLLKKLKQTEPVNYVILVEGYMDTISLYQAGIKNVVAPMGTSLTKKQCDILSRYTKMVYICFDGDSAGQNMTLRGLDLLKESGVEVKVVMLPQDKDPDDIAKERGKEGYMELVSQALPLIDFKLKAAENGFNLKTADGRKKYAMEAIKVLSTLNPVEKEVYAKAVSQKSGIAEQTIIAQATGEMPLSKPATTSEEKPSTNKALNTAARFVLASIIELKEYVEGLDFQEDFFEDEIHKEIYRYILDCIEKRQRPSQSDVFDIVENKEEANEINNILDTIPAENQRSYYHQCLMSLFNNYKAKELKRLAKALSEEKDASKKIMIAQKIKELNKTQPIL